MTTQYEILPFKDLRSFQMHSSAQTLNIYTACWITSAEHQLRLYTQLRIPTLVYLLLQKAVEFRLYLYFLFTKYLYL